MRETPGNPAHIGVTAGVVRSQDQHQRGHETTGQTTQTESLHVESSPIAKPTRTLYGTTKVTEVANVEQHHPCPGGVAGPFLDGALVRSHHDLCDLRD